MVVTPGVGPDGQVFEAVDGGVDAPVEQRLLERPGERARAQGGDGRVGRAVARAADGLHFAAALRKGGAQRVRHLPRLEEGEGAAGACRCG